MAARVRADQAGGPEARHALPDPDPRRHSPARPEAGEVPPGLRRLAWLAGGVQVMAGEALTARAIGRWLLFAAAAAVAAWAAWPDRPGGFDTVVARMDVITIVALLAGLPLLTRWLLGPAGDSRLGRFLRACGYAAVLALMAAKASAPRAGDNGFTGPALQFAWTCSRPPPAATSSPPTPASGDTGSS